MTTCKDLMTANPTCCTPDDNATRIAKLMKIENVGSLPICEDRGTRKLIGIVTDRDLTLEVIAAGKDPNNVKAKDVMTRDPITCLPEDTLQVALDRMVVHQIRRIPVTDNYGRLVGIIAQADLARRKDQREKVAELVEEVSRPSTVGTA
jgi:Predicted signal-transduction protein containing cAMP-binding and CBS domains